MHLNKDVFKGLSSLLVVKSTTSAIIAEKHVHEVHKPQVITGRGKSAVYLFGPNLDQIANLNQTFIKKIKNV